MEILAVMVRYQTPISDSQTIAGWRKALNDWPDLANEFKLLIHDNSPTALDTITLPPSVTYKHSKYNLGISGAFNSAIQYACQQRYGWILLLDQDTEITARFLKTMARHCHELDDNGTIAAIVPTVRVRGFIVSPRRQMFNHHRAYPRGESGVAPGEAFAINSGALLRTSALQAIGGFNTDFWLDYSDMYVFHMFYLGGWNVWRAADAELEHDMSVMDYDRLMTPARYKNYLCAESAFNDLYKGGLENAVQNMRLLVRAMRQRKKYRNPAFSQLAWKQLKYRLHVPKATRLTQWAEQGDKRRALQSNLAPSPSASRQRHS